MDHAVQCLKIGYAYGDWKALEGCSLSVEKGEYVAVAGRNGSGKSTLARHLDALLIPNEGQVLTFGMDTANEEMVLQIRSKAGMVFQNPDNQIVASVVEEDVAFGPENMGVPAAEIRQRVDDALATMGMSEFAKRAPHMLSGGQKQRVAIAGVLAMQPELVIFDEPTSMLDPQGREAVLEAMDLLHEKGITVIHITHDMSEALAALRLIIMDQGHVALTGTPQELFTEHMQQVEALGLELPLLMQTAQALRTYGVEAGAGLSMEEMVEAICQL